MCWGYCQVVWHDLIGPAFTCWSTCWSSCWFIAAFAATAASASPSLCLSKAGHGVRGLLDSVGRRLHLLWGIQLRCLTNIFMNTLCCRLRNVAVMGVLFGWGSYQGCGLGSYPIVG